MITEVPPIGEIVDQLAQPWWQMSLFLGWSLLSVLTIVLRKIDAIGRTCGQIEVCDRHAQVVIERERSLGLDILDRGDWQ